MKNRNDAVRFLEDCYQLYEQKMYHIGLKDDFISFFLCRGCVRKKSALQCKKRLSGYRCMLNNRIVKYRKRG